MKLDSAIEELVKIYIVNSFIVPKCMNITKIIHKFTYCKVSTI